VTQGPEGRGVIVIGGSAGSTPQVEAIIAALPSRSRVPVVLVLHRGADMGLGSAMAQRLSRLTGQSVVEVEDLDEYSHEAVAMAPPGYHTLIGREGPVLSSEPRQSYSIPSIDAAFESAAFAFHGDTVGVVLSSANEDGVDGARQILEAGGRVLVVDPAECEHPTLTLAVAALSEAECWSLESLIAEVSAIASSGPVEDAG
jgi:two-component system, chemotaxis family, protein-glutamate methylesterase/glutaminase